MEKPGTSGSCQFIRATSFLRQPDDKIPENKRLISVKSMTC